MSDRDILIEILAIKLYEHDSQSKRWPPQPGEAFSSWRSIDEEDREDYRALIRDAEGPQGLYT